ncbi:MAG: glycosyltransferase [Planctomycetales bacterium]|nr:glycosyltransferase [bacterium]UNM08493.1 MAG: glycosyltransferase [Planctomycetales bacterium]
MSTAAHRLSVVIPSYNALGTIEPLLTALSAIQPDFPGGMQVVISDDASTDGTVPELRLSYPQFSYREGRRNLGFGGNVNAGVQEADGEHIAIVNTDIELPADPFGILLDELRTNPELFAVMPLIWNTNFMKVENLQYLMVRRGLAWNADMSQEFEYTQLVRELLEQSGNPAFRLADLMEGREPVQSILCGALFVCSRRRFLDLGGFDTRYRPFYWEDVGLGYEAKRRGWQCAAVPRALCLHRHSVSIDRKVGAAKLDYLLLNQLRFVLANRDQLHGLRGARFWWLMRGLRMQFGGSKLLREAYMHVAMGRDDV